MDDNLIKFGIVIVVITTVNLISWAVACLFIKRRIPIKRIVLPIIYGLIASSIGFWGFDIYKLIFGY